MTTPTRRIPAGFKTPARNLWKRIWVSPTVNDNDYEAIILLCQLVDERAILNDWFKEHPRFLLINNNTNVIMHPYVKRIETIDKQTETLLNALGLTPLGRARIGMNTNVEEENPFEVLISKWAEEEKEEATKAKP